MPQPHVAVPIKVEDSTNGSVWALNNVDDDVPRNGMSQNGVGDERARQLMRDASDLFEGHIAGLVKAFQLLQQQSMELLQAPQPTGISCFPCAPEPSNQDIIMQPTFEVQLALPEDRRPSKPSRAISGYDGSMDLGPKMERRPSISAEDRLLKQQFHRWADASQTLITAESLVKILRLFLGDDEFEDIQAMVHFLTGKEADPQIDSPATEQTGHQSFGDQLLGGLGIRQKSTELSEGLDFESFVRLRQQVSFSGASSSVKRDIGKLQSALRGEELQVLFGEEAPLQEENEGYSNGVPACVTRALEIVPAIVIVLNSAIFAFQEWVPNDELWEHMETVFMVCYLLEASIKLYLLGCRGYFMGPEWAWNVFDFICLLFSVVDFGITQAVNIIGASSAPNLGLLMMIKMLRLARLARLIRALRYPIFRELNMMVMGVVSGVRVLIWAIILLFFTIYVAGVALHRLWGDDDRLPEFQSLEESMFTLFRCFTDGCVAYDGRPLQEKLHRIHGNVFFVCYVLFFMLVTVGIFNLIMAIFIDNVMTNQMERKQRVLSESQVATEIDLKEELCRLLGKRSKSNHIPAACVAEIESLETAGLGRKAKVRAQFECIRSADVVISRDAFLVWLADPEFISVLEEADIDVTNKSMLFDIMDADMGGSLSTEEVFRGLMQLRGPVSKGDIIGMSLRVTHIAHLVQSWTNNAFGNAGQNLESQRRISYYSNVSEMANQKV